MRGGGRGEEEESPHTLKVTYIGCFAAVLSNLSALCFIKHIHCVESCGTSFHLWVVTEL